MLATLEAKALAAAGALLLLILAALGLFAYGYSRGERARDAHYAPLLQAAASAKAAADARADELETAQGAITADLNRRHADETAELTSRLGDAQRRIADVLRERASCPSGGQVRPVPDSAPVRPTPGEGHDAAPAGGPGGGLGRRLAADAADAEHDASELERCEEWVERQYALNGSHP